VERALAIARRGIGAEDITEKDGRDLVTVTDVAVEDAVRGIVADALGFSVIGEERGGEASADSSPYWLVDPICGTRNFASGIPLYCVNLALVEGDEVNLAGLARWQRQSRSPRRAARPGARRREPPRTL
jgi:myo-inositol-1(or 4)-monophosphatase